MTTPAVTPHVDASTRLSADTSVLVVIDVQDKLLVKIPDRDRLVRNISFLLDAAALLPVPVLATEQYPQGLGPTTAELAQRLPADRPAKKCFSCHGSSEFTEQLRSLNRPQVVLSGMETHVCLGQTALDLLTAGYQVFVPVDAVAARFTIDHEVALRRLERAGAVLTTVEAIAFEWAGSADHPHFKALSRLVQDRMSANN